MYDVDYALLEPATQSLASLGWAWAWAWAGDDPILGVKMILREGNE